LYADPNWDVDSDDFFGLRDPPELHWVVYDLVNSRILTVTEFGEGISDLFNHPASVSYLMDREDPFPGCLFVVWASKFPKMLQAPLRHLVRSDKDAFHWALDFPEDADVMVDRIQKSETALKWVQDYGTPEQQRRLLPRITDPVHATEWAYSSPEDAPALRSVVAGSIQCLEWVNRFPEDREYMLQSVDNTRVALAWVNAYPEDEKALAKYLTWVWGK
jgi:hypothetical protein